MVVRGANVTVGDVFRVPISNNRSAFGQILAKYEEEMLFMVFFSLECDNDRIPPLSTVVASPPLFLANSVDAKIWRNDWPLLGNVPPNYDRIPLPKYKIRIGGSLFVESYDGLQNRPATDAESALLSFRTMVDPQILEDALMDHFETFDNSQFDSSQLVRLRKVFRSVRAELVLESTKVSI